MVEDSFASGEGKPNSTKKTTKNLPGPKINAPLPWWVELLFVQIGLPDKWLPQLLKTRKATKVLLLENRQSIYYTFIIIFSLIYVYPVIKQANMNNKCVDIVSKTIDFNSQRMSQNIKSQFLTAYQYCNGNPIIE